MRVQKRGKLFLLMCRKLSGIHTEKQRGRHWKRIFNKCVLCRHHFIVLLEKNEEKLKIVFLFLCEILDGKGSFPRKQIVIEVFLLIPVTRITGSSKSNYSILDEEYTNIHPAMKGRQTVSRPSFASAQPSKLHKMYRFYFRQSIHISILNI